MNINISLFRRTGLTKNDVESIKERFYDQAKDLEKDIKKLRDEVQKTQGDVDFWKSQLRKRTPTKKCIICKGAVEVWPFNTGAYYIKGNRVEHTSCPTQPPTKKRSK